MEQDVLYAHAQAPQTILDHDGRTCPRKTSVLKTKKVRSRSPSPFDSCLEFLLGSRSGLPPLVLEGNVKYFDLIVSVPRQLDRANRRRPATDHHVDSRCNRVARFAVLSQRGVYHVTRGRHSSRRTEGAQMPVKSIGP